MGEVAHRLVHVQRRLHAVRVLCDQGAAGRQDVRVAIGRATDLAVGEEGAGPLQLAGGEAREEPRVHLPRAQTVHQVARAQRQEPPPQHLVLVHDRIREMGHHPVRHRESVIQRSIGPRRLAQCVDREEDCAEEDTRCDAQRGRDAATLVALLLAPEQRHVLVGHLVDRRGDLEELVAQSRPPPDPQEPAGGDIAEVHDLHVGVPARNGGWKRIVEGAVGARDDDVAALRGRVEVVGFAQHPIGAAAPRAQGLRRSDHDEELRVAHRGLDVVIVEVGRPPLVGLIQVDAKTLRTPRAEGARQPERLQAATQPPRRLRAVGPAVREEPVVPKGPDLRRRNIPGQGSPLHGVRVRVSAPLRHR